MGNWWWRRWNGTDLDSLRVVLAEVEAARGSTQPLVVTVAATAPVTLAGRD